MTVDLMALASAVQDAPELLAIAAEIRENERVRQAHIDRILDGLKRSLELARRGKGGGL